MNRHVHAIFSDDIRQEIGGKITLVGIYGEQMLVSEMPCAIPKLCLTVKAISTAEDPFKSLRVAILQDEIVLAEAFAGDRDLPPPPLEKKDPNSILIQTATFNFIFTPLFIEKPCAIRVRVYDEGREEMRGQGLFIDLAPPEAIFPIA